jgi:hypothetical protein
MKSDFDTEGLQALALPYLLLFLVLVQHLHGAIDYVMYLVYAGDVHVTLTGEAALLHEVLWTSRDVSRALN